MSRFVKFARFVYEERRQLAHNALVTAKEGVVYGVRKAQEGGQFVFERVLNVVAIGLEKLVFRGMWKPKETGTGPRRTAEPGGSYDATDDMGGGYDTVGDAGDTEDFDDRDVWQATRTPRAVIPRHPVILPPKLKGEPHLHEVAPPLAPSSSDHSEEE